MFYFVACFNTYLAQQIFAPNLFGVLKAKESNTFNYLGNNFKKK